MGIEHSIGMRKYVSWYIMWFLPLDCSSTDHEPPEPRKGFKRRPMRGRRGQANNMHGSRSLTKLSGSSNGYGGMGMRGRSLSNLSLGHAPSMTSVREEPRRSTSTNSEYTDCCVASYTPARPPSIACSIHMLLSILNM